MIVKTFKPDDPELAAHLAAVPTRAADAGARLPPPYSPGFGDYIAGRLDAPPENIMAEVKRATKDEVVDLPDGRQIQIQAKGAPVVDEKAAERERELARRATEAAEADPLREIQPEGVTVAVTTKALVKDEAAKGK